MKFHKYQIFMFRGTDVLALEVSQISISALPCCMGITFFFDPRPAWERDFHSWWHLCSEKASFFIFSTPPMRESKKSMKSHLEAPSWTTRRWRREKQIGTKTSSSSLDYERNAFWLQIGKFHQIETELCVLLKNYNDLRLGRSHARSRNFNQIHQNYWEMSGK